MFKISDVIKYVLVCYFKRMVITAYNKTSIIEIIYLIFHDKSISEFRIELWISRISIQNCLYFSKTFILFLKISY
jgi:hypothetical protein